MSGEFNICGQSISRVTRAVLGTSWPVAGAERMGGGGGCDNYYRTGQSNRQHPVPGPTTIGK